MDYRQKAFEDKFTDAAALLDVDPKQVVSLKIRDNISSYRDYRELLHMLESEIAIHSQEISGNLQGRGYLVQNTKVKAIVVEHETGLEILYIAGSIASLIGLVPLILQCWSKIRDLGSRNNPRTFQSVETRRLDDKGKLIEERSHGLLATQSSPLSFVNTALMSVAEVLDIEINGLRENVHELAVRVNKLEGKKNIRKRRKKSSAKKKGK